ncbi:DNA repair protein Rad50 [Bacillus toyonensis]|uniref:DNA repair protein Rad50 n=1 Tax=Bacillus toyonensis TaxID=155322 RepID=A0ABX6G4U0_9BACI|nr:DNA repair protein Rad50 [Bacillus toyonensis]MED2737880.1 DNA repair protein Rad50 [Bacillus toyonensis]QHA15986.1 DNA repair protein Rad50 [Bacillus toyonensis]
MTLLKVDAAGVEAAVKGMKLYKETEKVLKDYEAEVEKLEEQRMELLNEKENYQMLMTENLLKQQDEKATVKQILDAKKDYAVLVMELSTINTVLEETEKQIADVKASYFPLLKEAEGKDKSTMYATYNMTQDIQQTLYDMLSAIVTVNKEMKVQHAEATERAIPILAEAQKRDHAYKMVGKHTSEFLGYDRVLESPTVPFNTLPTTMLQHSETIAAAAGNVFRNNPSVGVTNNG